MSTGFQKKVLFLDAYYDPEITAFAHLENDLKNALIAQGYQIEIICPLPTRGIGRETRLAYKKKKIESLHNGQVRVKRFWAPKEGKNPLIRAIRYFWCNFRTYHIAKKYRHVDIIFANSTPPTQGLIAGKVAKKLKKPFIFSLQEFLAFCHL